MAAYDDWWSSLPPPDELWRARGGPSPFAPNWGQLQDPGVFAAPRPQPAGDVILPRSAPSPFGDAMPPTTGEDSTFRLATAALAPYAAGNARLGGPSSVEGVGEDLSNKFLAMARDMPPELRQRLAIKSGYRDAARQMQVNPSAPNSLHGAGTGPPGTGRALDLVPDPEVLAWIRENGPQKYGVGFPLYPKDPREIDHLEAVSPNGARLSPGGALAPSQGQQRMAGIGDIFGGGQAPTPGLLDSIGYMDPREYDARRNSASMLGLYAGLLQGGGPSLQPRNFGSALGAGLIGQNQFGTQFDEAQQHRATAQAKLAEIDIKNKGFKLAQDWINQGEGGIKTPADTAGTPAAKPPNFGETPKGGDPRGMEPYIRERAAAYGIDPDTAVAVARSEGLSTFQSSVRQPGGGREPSWGAFQLYTGGGMGNDFQKDTGLDPSDPKNERATIDYALNQASLRGWGAWHGAKNTGIGEWQGIGATGAKPGTRGVAAAPDGEPPAPLPAGIPQVPNYARALGGPESAAPAPAVLAGPGAPAAPVMTQQAQYAADVAAGRRPILPPGTKFNSRGEAISPDLTATLPGQQSGANIPPGVRIPAMAPPAASGSTIRPIAATDAPEPPPDAGGNGPQFGSGVLRGPVPPVPTGPAPIPQAIAPAPPVPPPPPVTAPPGGAAPVTMPPAPPTGAAPVAGGPVSVTLPAAPTLPMPTIMAPQPLPAAPEMPGVPARPVIPQGGAAPAVSPQIAAQARRAQGVVLGLTMMGVHAPDFLQKEAGIAIAGRTAAAEAEAKQPIELQNKMFEASLTAAQKRWDALTDQQKETLAAQRGATKDQMQAMYANIHEQYKSILGLTTARAMEGEKTAGGAENTQTTMVIGNREVPMTVAQANRISRGETPEQVLGPNVLQLGKAANTGQIPEGYQMAPGAAGAGPRIDPLPGSPQAQALEKKQAAQQQSASVVTQDLRRAQDLVTGGFVTGLYGRGSQYLPGTDRTRFNALLSGIGANFSIDRLQQMREQSPTGGAVGQVTEGEHKLLRDSFGSLDPEQGEKQLGENIARVHRQYMDAINGSPEKLAKALRDGRITKDQHDAALAQRELPGGASAAAPIDKAAYDRLPPGSVFTAPDGSQRRKP